MKAEFIPFTPEATSNETYILYMTVFQEVKRYRDALSLEAGILYGYMKSRLIYFANREDALIDEKGHNYIIMSQEEMKFHLKVNSRATINRVLKELESVGLIRREKQGNDFLNGHVIRKNPDRIYVGQINLLPTDKFEKEMWRKDGTKVLDPFKANGDLTKEGLSTFFAKNMPTSISSSTSVHPVCTKNEHTGKSKSESVRTKNEHILINTINETDNETINDTSIGFAQQTDEKNSQIPKTEVEWFKESFNRTFLTQQTIDYLCLFNDLKLTRLLIDQIFGEKRHVENMRVFGDKKNGLKTKYSKIKGEIFALELEKAVRVFISQVKTAKNKIKNKVAYFRAMMQNLWETCLLNQDFYGDQLAFDAGSCTFITPLKNVQFTSKEERFDYIYGSNRPYHNGVATKPHLDTETNTEDTIKEPKEVNRIKETQTISEKPVVIQKEQEVNRQAINSVSTYQPNRLARTEIIPDHIAHPEKYQAHDSQEQLRKAELSLKSITTGLTPDEMQELKYLEQLETQTA
ncbi:replication initiator protein A [Enterococcus cecorum]|uniref:replication initiator protein A n=1 Tax=Enterococcus cecorum TaxID=44008 RepID=UPI001FABB7A3|nr:replication initiator protein A [Enterococcus cecorum]MCJ0538468.1 replication initiator protein A [Enterococcus cecorum]MCJ0546749.1 replication initiator protein A [Enterococcus cecorum]MCJ0551550.1 replication initiator protein A [Enterococcus cecorum]MCJ0570128.1 replication initiator protein A [Enterococcus cecorum]